MSEIVWFMVGVGVGLVLPAAYWFFSGLIGGWQERKKEIG